MDLIRDLYINIQSAADQKRPAVVETDRTVLYSEVLEILDQIIELFSQRGISKVAICHEQGLLAYATEIAAFISGVEFCPIGSNISSERKLKLLEIFSPDIIIAPRDFLGGHWLTTVIPGFAYSLQPASELAPSSNHEMKALRDTAASAYTIFTTGTTGFPKGVTISREALNNLIAWASPVFRIETMDRWAQYSGLGFDLSIFDIFMTFSHGAALVPFRTTGSKLLPTDLIAAHKITVWHSVPSAVDVMERMGRLTSTNLDSVRLFSFCGESLFTDQVRALKAASPRSRIFNTYGPTEACILCSHVDVTENIDQIDRAGTLPIGEPITGFEFEFIDTESDLKELVLRSPYLTKGYLSAESRALSSQEGTGQNKTNQSYRTGDLVRKYDNLVYFSNRNDGQVKLHGNRIDLSEIEAILRLAGCISAKCIVLDNAIVAFCETDLLSEQDLMEITNRELPHYSTPSRIVKVSEMPYNDNGKVDVQRLLSEVKRSGD